MANIYGDDDYEIDEFGRWEPYKPIGNYPLTTSKNSAILISGTLPRGIK